MAAKAKDRSKRIDLMASAQDEKNLIAASKKLGTNQISNTIFQSVEQVATMELILIDRESISQLDKLTEFARATLQNFLNEFFSLTGCSLTLQELETIFQHTGKLGSKSLIEQATTEMVRTKLFEQLRQKHPDMTITTEHIPVKDLTYLFQIACKMDLCPTVKLGAPVAIFWGIYSIDDNKITVIDSELEKLKIPYRHYAQGPEQLAKLQKVRALCTALNDICKDPDVHPDNGVFRLVFYDKQAARWMPTGSWITFNEQPQRILFTR